MATVFWDAYQKSEDIGKACSEAIRYAENHSEFLPYLGGPQHSSLHDIEYEPNHICPFGRLTISMMVRKPSTKNLILVWKSLKIIRTSHPIC